MSNNCKLRIIHWNADGVRTKIGELLDLSTHMLNADLIAISETRLAVSASLNTPGYVCYRKDKHTNGRGQGVALLVKRDIIHSTLTLPVTKSIEAVGISINISGLHYIVLSIYQSPNLPLLPLDLDLLLSLGPRVILAGDFNARHPNWCISGSNSNGKTLFKQMLKKNFIIHAPLKPTLVHYRPENQHTKPDLIIAHNVPNISDVETITALSSNHLPVFFTLDGAYTQTNRTFYKYADADWIAFRKFINQNISLSCKTFNSIEAVDNAVTNLSEVLVSARDKHVPVSTSVSKPRKLPRFIQQLIKKKNRLRSQEVRNINIATRKELRQNINILQTRIKNAIITFYDAEWSRKLSNVDNPSADLWRVVKSLKIKPSTMPPLTKQDGSITGNAQEQCNELAEAFYKNMCLTLDWSTSGNKVVNDVSTSINRLDDHTIRTLQNPVSPKEIWKHIRLLKARKSPGVDTIHNALLKNIPQRCVVLLTKIFNGCLVLGYFPEFWKTGKVIALKKPGKDDTIPSNYRPISLLPTLGKLLERSIRDRLNKCINHKLKDEQFGFRSGHSTIQQLARVCEHIIHNINTNNSTGMFLLDIEKAFDTVWHDGLLHKLLDIGVHLDLAKIVQAYLHNRHFRVHIGDHTSDLYPIPAGVPQGSILGPTLFLIYLNDMPKQTRTHLACFADDTASYTTASDVDLIIDRLQLSIELLSEYFRKWKLKLNSSKTEAIMFTRKRKQPNNKLVIDGHHIPWQKSVKYLGVHIDERINWSQHINKLYLKGTQALNALSPVLNRKSNLSPTTKLRIYCTLVRPCITYASPVWSSTCESNYRKLQTIQNKALKISYNTPFYINLKSLHSRILLPNIKDFILKQTKTLYLNKTPNHSNNLISSIGRSRWRDLKYIDTYKRYRLPHHYILGCDERC